MRIPFWHFISGTPSTAYALLMTTVISLLAGNMIRSEARMTASRPQIVWSIVGVTVITSIVATVLAAFHIAASQSGH